MVGIGTLLLAVAGLGAGDVTTPAGSPYPLDTLIGQGPVVLVFWNSWLPGSESFLAVLPEVANQVERRGWKGAVVVFQDDPEAALRLGATEPLVGLVDRRGELLRRFQVTRAPAVILLDDSGAVAGRAGPDRESVRQLLSREFRR
jgi:thioredoxin-like negative regulator of GroEL